MENTRNRSRENNPMYYKLLDSYKRILKLPKPATYKEKWGFEAIYAKVKKDITMSFWNGKYPVDSNINTHVCKSGTKVKIQKLFSDGYVCVTDSLEKEFGHIASGLDADTDLYDYEFVETTKNQ